MDRHERRRLGGSPLTVTRVGLGTAPLGGLYTPVADTDAAAVIAEAYQQDIRFFDTAPLYGSGLAEARLGRVCAVLPRDELVVATKVGRLLRPAAPAAGTPLGETLGPVFDFSYDGVMRSVEESLQRLGLERVDVLHLHDPDAHHDAALQGAFKALDALRSQGVIRAVGAGMNQVAMLLRFAREAPFDCFLIAGRYTLLDQSALPELLPECNRRGIGVILGGLFNSGILADPSVEQPTFNYRPASPGWVEKACRLDAVCARHGVPLKAATLQFSAAHPAVTVLLLGPRSVAELEENLAMLEVQVPTALWSDLRAEGLLEEGAPVPV